MPGKVLLEDTWEFKPIREQIQESIVTTPSGRQLKSYRVPGVMSVCDVQGGNGRIYPKAIWESNLRPGSHLQNLIASGRSLGRLEHPADGRLRLDDPNISHMIVEAKLQPDGQVLGEILILDELPAGNRLRVLIEAGYRPLVSSRGFGSVTEDRTRRGVSVVEADYNCDGWDVVHIPSFDNAQLNPAFESLESPVAVATAPVAAPAPVVQALAESASAATPQPPAPKTNMNINDIRSSVGRLRSLDTAKLTLGSLTESLIEVSSLRRQLSEGKAATPGLAYDCDALATQLTSLEESWEQAINKPRQLVEDLTKQNQKVTVLAESLAKTGRIYHSALQESMANNSKLEESLTEFVKRGRQWHSIAVKRLTEAKSLNEQLDVVCEAMDLLGDKFVRLEESERNHKEALKLLAEQYHTDTTAAARALVEAQLPDKAVEFKTKLAECKTVDEVVAVRAIMEGKTTATPAAPAAPATAPAAAPAAPAPAAPVTSAPSLPAPGTVIMEAGNVRIEQTKLGNQLSLTESLEVTKRLSARSKTANK